VDHCVALAAAVEYNRGMSPQDVAAMEPSSAGLGVFSRLAGVFFEPSKTFADIARRPTWIVPLLLTIVASLGLMTIFGHRIGWDRLVRQKIETSSRAQQIPPEQKEQVIATQARIANMVAYAGAVVATPITYLLIAAIFTALVAGIMSVPVRFKQVLAVVAFASLPNILSMLLTYIVMFLKNPADFDLQNPLMFNVGAWMDPEHSSKFLLSVATSIDLFSFWVMLLMATGIKAAAGKRLSFGGALFVVVLPWAVYVLAKSGIAAAFG
jgi:hypothetical protein